MTPNIMSPIGVFDTGRGGNLVAGRLRHTLPDHQFVTVDDVAHAPYGTRSNQEIIRLAIDAIRSLVDGGCKVIVVACNTATTIAIKGLREYYPNISFIGFEPMIKPAAEQTQTGSIMVLATPATLRSERYNQLKELYAKSVNIIEPDCRDWASLIQSGTADRIDMKDVVDAVVANDCDQVVLGCTHYLAIESELDGLLPTSVTILEPTDAVTQRLKEILGLAALPQL